MNLTRFLDDHGLDLAVCPLVVGTGVFGGSALAAHEHVQIRRDAVRIGPPAIDGEASTNGSEGECARPGALSSARGLAGGPPLPARGAQLQPPVRDFVAPRPGDRGREGEVGITKLGCIVLSPERRFRGECITECVAGGGHAYGLVTRQLKQDSVQYVAVVREALGGLHLTEMFCRCGRCGAFYPLMWWQRQQLHRRQRRPGLRQHRHEE